MLSSQSGYRIAVLPRLSKPMRGVRLPLPALCGVTQRDPRSRMDSLRSSRRCGTNSSRGFDLSRS